MFNNLCYLNFDGSSLYDQQVSFDILSSTSTTTFSSNLLKLHVNLENFNDCLYLLNYGRFDKLHSLYVNILSIRSDRPIENTVN
jgi:hypothetical protein